MSPCLRPNRERDLLEHGLNALARRQVRPTDPDLVHFAARVHRAHSPSLAPSARNDIWNQMLSSTTTPQTSATTSTLSASSWRPDALRQHVRDLSSHIALPRIPAPAVVLFGVVMALVIALSGFGHDGGEMVTPTAYAQHAATAVASPASPQPTSTLTLDDNS